MRVISDLQLHSRFSRAVSSQMTIPVIAEWSKKKGIDLVATGDWTHPIWFREIEANLSEEAEGLYKVKDKEDSPYFLLSTEVSSIYSQAGKVRRVHTLIFAPNLETVRMINSELTKRGANLVSDGRPIMGLSPREITELVLTINEKCLIIPAHAWTPHFSVFGSMSGFDSLKDCFGEYDSRIYAIETGLSSDPAMNWRVSELEKRSILSFSDAHSPAKLGREATVFELSNLNYETVRQAIIGSGKEKIAFTIEFYPEEGKYHYTGHRNCSVVYSPNESRKKGIVCPVCGRNLTVGVMSRVEELSSYDIETESEIDDFGTRFIKDKKGLRPPYIMLVPLMEILAEVFGVGVGSKKVLELYEILTTRLDNEFKVLFETSIENIKEVGGERVAQAIQKVRLGNIFIEPGFDGVFGKVKIWKDEEVKNNPIDQGSLF